LEATEPDGEMDLDRDLDRREALLAADATEPPPSLSWPSATGLEGVSSTKETKQEFLSRLRNKLSSQLFSSTLQEVTSK